MGQLNEIDAVKGPDKFLPHLLGHEGSGIIEDIGPGINRLNIGDKVVLHWRKGEGIQCIPPKYHFKLSKKEINAGWVTTFNQIAVISENRITKIPKDFDMRIAPLFGCAVTTAFGVINNNAKIKIGESVIIIGVGGVGMNIVQGAKMVSASPIIAIDINNSKLNMSKKFGADITINYNSDKNIKDNIISLLEGCADVVIDTTGLVSMIEFAYEITSSTGR